MSYGFCGKFHTLSNVKSLKNRLTFDKVTESVKVGTFSVSVISQERLKIEVKLLLSADRKS